MYLIYVLILTYLTYITNNCKQCIWRNDSSTNWKCDTVKCPGRANTKSNGPPVIITKDHNHLPNPALSMLLQQRKDINSEANSKSRNKPRRIIRDANSELPKEVLAQLPTQEASRQVINRIKRKQVDGGVNPITRAEIMIPTDLKFTLNGERFLFEDTDDDDRIIIFTTFENLRILKRNLDWLCDGTFDIAPQTHI